MARIIWHDSARTHLRLLFNYQYDNYSVSVAYSLLKQILTIVQVLENNPRVGAPEMLLLNRQKDYRYLVVKHHYKVIYYISVNDDCHIVAIWDTRRDPEFLQMGID